MRGSNALVLTGLAGLMLMVLLARGCRHQTGSGLSGRHGSFGELALIENPRTPAEKIVNGAKEQVIRGVTYNAEYRTIPYPDGDVPADQGACTDVVIRALRATGCDLQKLIHEDKRAHPSRYPRYPGQPGLDPSIDHRRVPNQIAFMKAHALELPIAIAGRAMRTWQPGDIIYVKLFGTMDHCGVLSNDRGSNGLPLVIHNAGMAAQEDRLGAWLIIRHFRYPTPRTRPAK